MKSRKDGEQSTSGNTGNDRNVNMKTKVDRLQVNSSPYIDVSGSESSDDEGTGDEDDTPEELPSKQAKLTGFENENSTNDSESKLSKLKSLFNDNVDQEP